MNFIQGFNVVEFCFDPLHLVATAWEVPWSGLSPEPALTLAGLAQHAPGTGASTSLSTAQALTVGAVACVLAMGAQVVGATAASTAYFAASRLATAQTWSVAHPLTVGTLLATYMYLRFVLFDRQQATSVLAAATAAVARTVLHPGVRMSAAVTSYAGSQPPLGMPAVKPSPDQHPADRLAELVGFMSSEIMSGARIASQEPDATRTYMLLDELIYLGTQIPWALQIDYRQIAMGARVLLDTLRVASAVLRLPVSGLYTEEEVARAAACPAASATPWVPGGSPVDGPHGAEEPGPAKAQRRPLLGHLIRQPSLLRWVLSRVPETVRVGMCAAASLVVSKISSTPLMCVPQGVRMMVRSLGAMALALGCTAAADQALQCVQHSCVAAWCKAAQAHDALWLESASQPSPTASGLRSVHAARPLDWEQVLAQMVPYWSQIRPGQVAGTTTLAAAAPNLGVAGLSDKPYSELTFDTNSSDLSQQVQHAAGAAGPGAAGAGAAGLAANPMPVWADGLGQPSSKPATESASARSPASVLLDAARYQDSFTGGDGRASPWNAGSVVGPSRFNELLLDESVW